MYSSYSSGIPSSLYATKGMPLERYSRFLEGKLYLVQPQGDIAISHLETDPVKLKAMYDSGYTYGKSICEEVKKFLAN